MDKYSVRYEIKHGGRVHGLVWVGGVEDVIANDKSEAKAKAIQTIIQENPSSIKEGRTKIIIKWVKKRS